MQDAFYDAIAKLPAPFGALLAGVDPKTAVNITEIRLRAARPLLLVCSTSVYYLLPSGGLSQIPNSAVIATVEQVSECFLALCDYSVHSCQNQLKNGYLTLPGGHRVGVAGTAVCDSADTILQLKDIRSLNIRVAREILQQPNERIVAALQESGGIILAGEPKSGKTTVLRMISQRLSDNGAQVAVVDQRRELWPDGSLPGLKTSVPLNCDVLAGYSRAEGIIQALRCLSPDAIVCDEVGSMQDTRAIESGANAGVRMVVSIHARNKEEFLRRPQAKLLLATGAFSKLILLAGKQSPGRVETIYDCDTIC